MEDVGIKKKNAQGNKYRKLQKHFARTVIATPRGTYTYGAKHLGIPTEKNIMSQDTYSKSEIDLKLDKINSDVKHGFEKVDLKSDQLRTEMRDGFENMGLRMEKMFSDFKLEQHKEKEENKKWLIALTVGSLLSIIGIVISIIAILVQK